LADVDKGKTFTLHSCPGGTGQITAALANNEIDIAIALTDALIAGIANGRTDYKLVGSYVSTPLNWAVVTGVKSRYKSIADLRGTTIGISRLGSGSQTMAYVMALNHNWFDTKIDEPAPNLEFRVNNDLQGLLQSVNDGSTSAFLWEWFTTKPYVDSGKARFIGSVPTPWPSWMIVARNPLSKEAVQEVKSFVASLTTVVRAFDALESREHQNVEFIKTTFGYSEADVKEWMQTVAYPENCAVVKSEVIATTWSILQQAGVVGPSANFSIEDLVNVDVGILE